MKHESKYWNVDGWLAPIRDKDPLFAIGLEKIHGAICMADDIADRQLHPENVSEAVWLTLVGMDILFERPSCWPRIKLALNAILESEKINLNYVPGKYDIEQEIKFCLGKATLIDFYFQAFCCLYPEVETPENLEWINELKEYCLIIDDCEDILSGTFEDLRNCRRNYVVLKYFGPDFYFNWESNKAKLIDKAKELKSSVKMDPPKDKRLGFFIGENYGDESK